MALLPNVIGFAFRAAILAVAFFLAYDIRMYAIREYGRLIHGINRPSIPSFTIFLFLPLFYFPYIT
jgi:hypothetical protein